MNSGRQCQNKKINNPEPQSPQNRWRVLMDGCARIYQSLGMQQAKQEMLALLEELQQQQQKFPEHSTGTAAPEGIAWRILEEARKMRRVIVESEAIKDADILSAAIDLNGELYELAIEQAGDSEHALDIIRELTFFLLLGGKSEYFLMWSREWLDRVKDNSSEYRATVFAIGIAQIFTGGIEPAKMTFRRLLKEFSEASEAHFGLALIYLKLKQSRNFQKSYTQLNNSAPELAEIVERLAAKDDFSAEDCWMELEQLDQNAES